MSAKDSLCQSAAGHWQPAPELRSSRRRYQGGCYSGFVLRHPWRRFICTLSVGGGVGSTAGLRKLLKPVPGRKRWLLAQHWRPMRPQAWTTPQIRASLCDR